MSKPATTFVKRQQLLEWLHGEGIAEKQTEKLIASGIIRKTPLPGMTYAHYSVAQVQRDVIDKMLSENGEKDLSGTQESRNRIVNLEARKPGR